MFLVVCVLVGVLCACFLSHVVYILMEAPSQFFSPNGRGRRKLFVSPLVYLDPEPYARTVAQMTAHPGQEQSESWILDP